ncbi:MAG: hypothetical protein P1U89_09210 [Verrucomicrobiales bacterium]|nr:hypothetical protein [Verrucomicrobiales bacterium]
MRARGIRPENEIFLILLIVFIIVFALNRPRYVDAALSIDIKENFGSKTARITEELQLELLDAARSIDQISRKHGFDGLEIIGHADTAPVQNRSKRYDLDSALAAYLKGQSRSLGSRGSNLDRAASILANDTVSNTELGMVRAVVVTQFFQELREEGKLFKNIDFFVPMSAGSMVDTDYSLDTNPSGKDDSKRRRIEFQLFSTRDRSRDDLKAKSE